MCETLQVICAYKLSKVFRRVFTIFRTTMTQRNLYIRMYLRMYKFLWVIGSLKMANARRNT